MTDLQVLNLAMEKLGHGQTVPMRLNINVGGAAREIDVTRNETKVQDLVHLLVIELLKGEVKRTSDRVQISEKHLESIPEEVSEGAPTKYDVRVQITPNGIRVITVVAWQPRDARVMAYILAHPNCPISGTPEDIFRLAMDATEIAE
jgi:hypothetical protein